MEGNISLTTTEFLELLGEENKSQKDEHNQQLDDKQLLKKRHLHIESDDTDCDRALNFYLTSPIPFWIDTFSVIPGLSIIRNFLNEFEQTSILSLLHKDKNDWLLQSQQGSSVDSGNTSDLNQRFHFGNPLPPWAEIISKRICSVKELRPLVLPTVKHRKPLFNQSILNLYECGGGIIDHVDLLRFEDGIVGLSLLSSCIMQFKKVKNTIETPNTTVEMDTQHHSICKYKRFKSNDPSSNNSIQSIDVLLKPGDLYVLYGRARYQWTHGIPFRSNDIWEGKTIPRSKRISITLRYLKPDPKK